MTKQKFKQLVEFTKFLLQNNRIDVQTYEINMITIYDAYKTPINWRLRKNSTKLVSNQLSLWAA